MIELTYDENHVSAWGYGINSLGASEISELLNYSAPLFSSERLNPHLEREIKKFRVHSDPKENHA